MSDPEEQITGNNASSPSSKQLVLFIELMEEQRRSTEFNFERTPV